MHDPSRWYALSIRNLYPGFPDYIQCLTCGPQFVFSGCDEGSVLVHDLCDDKSMMVEKQNRTLPITSVGASKKSTSGVCLTLNIILCIGLCIINCLS